MSYGDANWSVPSWGQPGEFVELMLARLLMFVQQGPRFRGMTNALAQRTEDLLASATLISAAFDLNTAEGQQLDRIGALLQRARLGLDDTAYRSLLMIHIDLVVASSGIAENILGIVERLTGTAAPEYAEFYPAQFVVGAVVDSADVALLRLLIQQSRGWGIYGAISLWLDPNAEILLADIDGDPRVWSQITDDQVFAPDMDTLIDIPSAQTGTADGTVYVPATDSRDFDGITDRLDFAGIEQAGAPKSFACWVTPATLSGDQRIWSTRSAAGSGSSFFAITAVGALILLIITDGTLFQRVTNALTITPFPGTWFHVAFTSDGTLTAGNSRIYVNGSEVSAYATTTDGTGVEASTAFGWHIGGRFVNDTANLEGEIADVRSWNRELSAAEINNLYTSAINAGSGSFLGPPTAGAPLVDNPGVLDTVADPQVGAFITEVTIT